MELVNERIERYALEHTSDMGASMDELEQQARVELPYPSMLSGPVVGRLLQTLVFALGARRVLEIGTYAGYSALAMASALPDDGQLITCEISPEHAGWAQRRFDESPHGGRIDLRLGPALDTVRGLSAPFELVFIDADKIGYRDYFEATLRLLAPRGLIVFDNMLRDGAVLDGNADSDDATRLIMSLNDELARDERVASVLLTVRDGVTIVRPR